MMHNATLNVILYSFIYIMRYIVYIQIMRNTRKNKAKLIGVTPSTISRWQKGSPEKKRLYDLIDHNFYYLVKLKKAQEIIAGEVSSDRLRTGINEIEPPNQDLNNIKK